MLEANKNYKGFIKALSLIYDEPMDLKTKMISGCLIEFRFGSNHAFEFEISTEDKRTITQFQYDSFMECYKTLIDFALKNRLRD